MRAVPGWEMLVQHAVDFIAKIVPSEIVQVDAVQQCV
jgi:hypothetical protein